MDTTSCNGCRRRDILIAGLEARVARLEAALAQQRQLAQRLTAMVQRLTERLAQYEPEVRHEGHGSASASGGSAGSGGSGGAGSAGSFSVDAELRRRRRRHRRHKKSPGRKPTEVKFVEAERVDEIYPPDVPRNECHVARERAVWRLENGRAVLVGYRIFTARGREEPSIPGVTPRCEYGIEILVVLAFLVYIIGISLDKACAVLAFFCQLPLRKSQADALLRQLAQHWEAEFVVLCDLIAHAAVVYLDETSWRVGKEKLSLWALASSLQRVFWFGCNKDDETLDVLLPPEIFAGIGVSDDASVYRGRFLRAQKCWAHLLRKMIRLAMLYPRKRSYQRFLDQLLQLYRDAQRAAEDGRLGEQGRKDRVAALEGRLCDMCVPFDREVTPEMKPHEQKFTNLIQELLRLMLAEELFTFVLEPEVEPTNNGMERLLRGQALDRKAGRINQTPAGAYRRSVILSVLESLRANLKQFTLAAVLEEINRWLTEGVSLFAQQWQQYVENQPVVNLDSS
jgi:transposase